MREIRSSGSGEGAGDRKARRYSTTCAVSCVDSDAGAAVLPVTAPRLRDDRFKHLDGQVLDVANATQDILHRQNDYLGFPGLRTALLKMATVLSTVQSRTSTRKLR